MLGAIVLPSHPMSCSPSPHTDTGPIRASLGFPFPWCHCVARATNYSYPRAPISALIPCLYPTGPPATPWRGPTGSSSIRGPFRAPRTGRSYPLPFLRALGPFPSVRSCPGRLATFPLSWHPWPTYVLAREHSMSRRLWPSRDATTRTPTRAWRGVVFCVLYACTACCLAVVDVVLHTSYGTLPF